MRKFVFRWRRQGWFQWWRKALIVGSRYDAPTDRMTLYFENGSIQEIPGWSTCGARLGTDWVLAQKEIMEKDAGQPIKLATEPN